MRHIVFLFFFTFSSIRLPAEALDDKFTQISPRHVPGAGEYVHGQGYGKILIRVLIFGAVPTQGIHYVPEGTDLLFAIVYAGGYTDTTKLNGITVRRRDQNKLLEIDLEDLMKDGEPIPKLVDGDAITVPFNWRKDFSTILTITGFISSLTALTFSIIALRK